MAEENSKPDNNTSVVFIDTTTLNTHLALFVSPHDTVSHLKKRIQVEHPLCFPKMGPIEVHAVKVKRKGYFYHLSDSMLVRSAFSGANKTWFLSVDASALAENGQSQQLLSSGSPKKVACLAIANNSFLGPGDDAMDVSPKRVAGLNYSPLPQLENRQDEKEEVPFVSPCVSEHAGKEVVKNLGTDIKSSSIIDTGIPLPCSIPETEDHHNGNIEPPSLQLECEADRTSKSTTKDDGNVEEPSISVPSVKKQRKSKRKKEDTVRDDISKENIASVDNAISVSSKMVSSSSNFKVPQVENKLDDKEGHFVGPCVSEHTGKEFVQNLEKSVKSSGNNDPGIPLHGSIPEADDNVINECQLDQSSKATAKDDCNVREEDPSISVASTKKKRKSKKNKADTRQDDTSKENIDFVDNALSVPSKRVSSFNNIQTPHLENNKDEKEESHFVSLCVSSKVVKNLGKGVNSSSNNDNGLPLLASIPETEDHSNLNNEPPSKVDSSSKGITKDDNNVEEDPSTPMPSVKEKRKSKRKKEHVVQDDTSKENIASVDIPLSVPSKKVSSFDNFQAPQLENKQNEKETIGIGKESMKEASPVGPATNKKHRKRKRSKEMLEVETSQKDEAQKSDEAPKQSKESKDQFELDNDKSMIDVQVKSNRVLEDVSDTRPPAKKKQKGKEKNDDKSLSKEKSSKISDFNAENVLEDQLKIKNNSNEQLAEHFKDADPVKTSVLDKRKKGKKNSSNPHQTPVDTSSRKGNEADHSSIQECVEEGISEDGILSKGVDFSMNKTTTDNLEIGMAACKEGVGSKVPPSDVLSLIFDQVNKPKELTEDNVNVVIDHCHKNDTLQSEGAEDGREISPQNDPTPMLVEESPPSNQDNTGANIKESNGTSKVDENGMTEPVKSEKKKRGTRKPKDSSGGPSLSEGTGLVDASDNENFFMQFFKATNCDPKSGNTEIDENPLNQTEGEKKQQQEMKSAVLSADAKEDDPSADNAGSLDNAEHVYKRQRKRSNKETSTLKSISNHASGKSKGLEKRIEHIPISNSKLEVSKMEVQNKAGKASGHNVGGVVSSTQQKKSLLEVAIFKEDSSGTSEDEGGVDNSDASTRTPSDNSLESDFSDVDSNGERSALKDGKSGSKVAINHVLRSSRRYKKAKITASQTESQLEFVPDSLAD